MYCNGHGTTNLGCIPCIRVIWIKINDPRSLRSRCIKGADKSTLVTELCSLHSFFFTVGADWLQGPHVYALFSSYGMTSKQINQLFVVGFGSSMVFGTVVGSFADKL